MPARRERAAAEILRIALCAGRAGAARFSAVLVPSLLAGLIVAASPPAPPTVITLTDRAPLAFVLNTPSGEKGRLRVSGILDALAGPLQQHTDLMMAPLDASAVAECEGGLACLARRAPRGANLLLVLSYFAASQDRPDRLSALLVDVGAADACAADPFAGDNVDGCVSERAVRERPPAKNISEASEATSALSQLVQQDLRATLEATGHWEATGQLALRGVPSGAALLIDERTVAVAPGGPLLIQGLTWGEHDIAYAVSGHVIQGQSLTLVRGEPLDVAFAEPGAGLQRPLIWSGATLAAVGAGLSIWSIGYATSQSDLTFGCTDEPPCSRTFVTLERQVRGSVDVFEVGPNEGSVLALPLGYSLVTAGAVIAGGAYLLEDDFWTQVLVIGAGVLAGGLTYGISAAAN